MASSELLQLKWNSYEANFHLAFSEIRENNKFHDVTIATPDGHVLAHRVLLSAFSPVLARILDMNPHPHPLLYIHGISHKSLSSILDFMYKGEAHISQDTMEEFLAAAEELKVKGLSDSGLDKDSVNVSQNVVNDSVNTSQEGSNQSNDSIPMNEESSNVESPQPKSKVLIPPKYCLNKAAIEEKEITKELTTPTVDQDTSKPNGSYEEIVIDDDDEDEDKIDNAKKDGENSKKSPDNKKDLKRKSETEVKIENAIDSVIRNSLAQSTPKVRKVSSTAYVTQVDSAPKVRRVSSTAYVTQVDSDGAPILNANREIQLLDDEMSIVSGGSDLFDYQNPFDGIDVEGKIIYTKSDEDKARFKAHVESMFHENQSINGYDCLICGKQFPSAVASSAGAKRNAMSHVDFMHTDNCLHKCTICNVLLKCNDALTRHIGKLHKNKEVFEYEPVN